MKTTIIYPNIIPGLIGKYPPLGVALLKGYLNNRGHGFVALALIGGENLQRRVTDLINKNNPGLVGVSIQFSPHLKHALAISKIIKSINKNIFITFGGPIISKNIEYILKKENLNHVDALITGPGEEPLVKLIGYLHGSGDLHRVPNLHYKDNNQFKKSDNSVNVTGAHLNVVPDFDDLPIHGIIPLRLSVGCPWGKCTFCTYPLIQKKHVILPPQVAAGLMKRLVQAHGPKTVKLLDDALSPAYLQRLSGQIIKESLDIKWRSFYLCLDNGFLKDNIPLIMRASGFRGAFFGVESASPRLLKLMNKMQHPHDVLRIIDRFCQTGAVMGATFMVGFPTETKDEALQSLALMLELKKRYGNFKIFVQKFGLEDGTYIYNNPSKFSITSIDKSGRRIGARKSFYYETSTGMTMDEIDDMHEYIQSKIEGAGQN